MSREKKKVPCSDYPCNHYLSDSSSCPWCQLEQAEWNIKYLLERLSIDYNEYVERKHFYDPFEDKLVAEQLINEMVKANGEV